MTETLVFDDIETEVTPPDVSHIITEDDTPVDNLFSEKQMRLLAESLYASWRGPADGRPFVVMANVGLFFHPRQPPLVPDVLLSLGVTVPEELWDKSHRSYFIWEYGKPPEVVIEVVSNQKGGELNNKLLDYARLGVAYYVVFDPDLRLSDQQLRIFSRQGPRFQETTDTWFSGVDLGVTLWTGEYEGAHDTWLRWRNEQGALIVTGKEAAGQAAIRAEQAETRAEQAETRAEQAEEQAARLAAKLRALGIDPDTV